MSIYAKYRRITPEELAEFLRNPAAISNFFGQDRFDELLTMEIPDDEEFDEDAFLNTPAPVDDPERILDITNDWQAVHFLLTGEVTFPGQSNVAPPLLNVVMGGTPISTVDVGYGPPRYLTPDEVRAAYSALSEIDIADLGRRFDVGIYNAEGGYPRMSPTGWRQENVVSLLEIMSALRDFFQAAASDGDALLLWAT